MAGVVVGPLPKCAVGEGDLLRRRAEGWVGRMGRGFRQGEVSFLLIMRLIPAVPFFIKLWKLSRNSSGRSATQVFTGWSPCCVTRP